MEGPSGVRGVGVCRIGRGYSLKGLFFIGSIDGVIDLAQLRREIGVTQAELADRLGVKQAAVSKLERKTDLLVSSLTNYLEALGVDTRITVTVSGREHEYVLTNSEQDAR